MCETPRSSVRRRSVSVILSAGTVETAATKPRTSTLNSACALRGVSSPAAARRATSSTRSKYSCCKA
ncbi:hypothetical protein ACFPRL_31260 [Pseudoclavibacter helvolus]